MTTTTPNATVYRYTDDLGEHLSTERTTCTCCQTEGWRGDWPDQGGVVPSGSDLLCDDCAHGLVDGLDALLVLLRTNPAGLDWTSLPEFGGRDPEDTEGVWSWDVHRLIVGTCADDVRITSREDWAEDCDEIDAARPLGEEV